MVLDFDDKTDEEIARIIFFEMEMGEYLVIRDLERGSNIMTLIRELHKLHNTKKGSQLKLFGTSYLGNLYVGKTWGYRVKSFVHIWRTR